MPDPHKALHTKWQLLAAGDPSSLSPEELAGLPYYRAATGDPATRRIQNRLRTLEDIEEFTHKHGTLPANAERSRRSPRTADETHLAYALTRMRTALRQGHLDDYTLDRLQGIPSFNESLREEAWELRLAQLESFVSHHRRAPRRRSPDPGERALARFGERALRDGLPGYIALDRAHVTERLRTAMAARRN